MTTLHITVDASGITGHLAEVADIAERRGSLEEFRNALLEFVDGLPDGFESTWVDVEALPAGARKRVLSLQLGKRLLSRLAALRALDRDFDSAGNRHGASV